MEPFRFIKKHSIISIFFSLAILTIISINYLLIDIPQCWKFGYITGQILTNFAIGYVVSLIFYFLVVYLKDKKDHENISPRISKAIVLILDKGDSLEKMLYKGGNNTSRTLSDIKRICEKTKLYDINYSSNTKKLHWVDYLKNVAVDCKYFMEKIFKLNGIDTELMKILTDLDDSAMLERPQLIVGLAGIDERTMEPLSNQIIQFFEILNDLETYWEKNYSDFIEHKKMRRFKR